MARPNPAEINELSTFLDHAEEDLKWVMDDDGQELLDPEFREIAQPAWEEVRRRFAEARVEAARRWTEGDFLDALDRFGFSGPSWSYKRQSYERDRSIFRRVWDELRTIPGRSRRAITRAVKPLFKKVLGWINLILGSLSKVITQLDLVKEFKEGVELNITD